MLYLNLQATYSTIVKCGLFAHHIHTLMLCIPLYYAVSLHISNYILYITVSYSMQESYSFVFITYQNLPKVPHEVRM